MFERIVAWSLASRVLVLAAAIALLAIGGWQAQRLPVDVLPDLTRPTVTVQIEAPGLAPEDVEAQVTYPLETALSGLPSISRLRSVSGNGLAIVYAEFDWATDVYRNRQLVAERLEAVRAQLPAGLVPRIGPPTSLMGEILLIALQADGSGEAAAATSAALRDHADWTMRPALLAVPGVAQVLAIGGTITQFELQPDLQRLRSLNVPLVELEAAVRGYGQNLGGGLIVSGGQELNLRALGRPFKVDELEQAAIPLAGRPLVRVGEVASIVSGSRQKRGDAGANGHAAVILAVQKQPGVDTLALTTALEARLAALDRHRPPGSQRLTVFRQADFIRHSIDNVLGALRDGALIVAIVLFAFLASGRATVVALAAIPLSVMATLVALQIAGLSINTMTLGGIAIAIGELVDDAVVGVENVVRRLRQRRDGESALAIVGRATVEVRAGILYATLLIVLVFVPLFALGGVEGRLFAPLGVAYIAAILASLVVAITVTPVLCAFGLARHAALPVEPRWLARLKASYVQVLERSFGHARTVMLAAVALVLVSAVLALNLPRAFLPPFNEGTLTINLIATPGIALAESDRIGRIAENLILDVPEVASVGRRTGRAEADEHAEGVHYSELDVVLRDDARRSRREIAADLRSRLAVLPVSVSIGQPISHRLDHLLSGVRAPLVAKIVGDDLPTLRRLADEVQKTLAAIPGLADVQIEPQVDVPQLQVRIDARLAADVGIAPARAQDALNALTLGLPLAQIVDGETRHDLVLRLPEAERAEGRIPDLLIDGANGPQPLSTIAAIERGSGPNQILREHLRRRIVVAAFAGDGRFDRASDHAREQLAALTLPPGYEIVLEGQGASQRAALARIGGLAVLSLLLMVAVLYSRYGSLRLTAIVLGNVPFALVGGIAALAVTGTALSVASLVGFVTLAGIAARNGILKVSHFLTLARDEGEAFGPALVLRGSAERLTPVLMTALIAALALTPLLWDAAAPGKEILHPVALVIFGGLVSSTVLDSFLTPALFLRFAAPDVAEHLSARR